ncbi:hypothetical protein HWN40_05740 [Methanolobus zinderi]|uniref:Uncharacterized protein n=1 Tax=Methanolobus zinderi TaxID=536044 RepID=A0A7D5EGB9_9EURY|nr:hypothetical protein [Methanolobus zinderi]QLC49780.1 hypothetical protein HWN40_05740 [Methanolobus zinderi]
MKSITEIDFKNTYRSLILSLLLFLIILKFDFIIFLLPIIALGYGRFSKNQIAACIIGSFPCIFSLLYIVFVLSGYPFLADKQLLGTIIYWISLTAIMGTVGYASSYNTSTSLIIAFGLLILAEYVLYSGLD